MKAGTVIVAQYRPKVSFMSNPGSANMVSPGRRYFKIPQLSVKVLSLHLPPHPLEVKLTMPFGVIPIKYSTVL